MRHVLLALVLGAVAGCEAERPVDDAAAEPANGAQVADMHTSRDALDWQGRYEGLLPCSDCAGIHTLLTLNADGTFEIVARRLVGDADATTGRGQFRWEPDGRTVALDAAGSGWRFAVGEGRVLLFEAGQAEPAWNRTDLALLQSSPDGTGARPDLVDVLEDHHWTLANATDRANQRIDDLFPVEERTFVFGFAESRVLVQGGCNGIRGGYRIDPGGKLVVTGAMSTMMACEAPLMAADGRLSALLAEPLEPILVSGVQPTLVLLSTTGDALTLTGELTPEARYGAPTTIFLEVAPHAVSCEHSPRGDGMCLEVRELTFDERGLPAGTPSDWRILEADIEGYRHEAGIRNVLRIRRFDRDHEAGLRAAPIHVLDLVVESEVVSDRPS